jgi:hypothetical protein
MASLGRPLTSSPSGRITARWRVSVRPFSLLKPRTVSWILTASEGSLRSIRVSADRGLEIVALARAGMISA